MMKQILMIILLGTSLFATNLFADLLSPIKSCPVLNSGDLTPFQTNCQINSDYACKLKAKLNTGSEENQSFSAYSETRTQQNNSALKELVAQHVQGILARVPTSESGDNGVFQSCTYSGQLNDNSPFSLVLWHWNRETCKNIGHCQNKTS